MDSRSVYLRTELFARRAQRRERVAGRYAGGVFPRMHCCDGCCESASAQGAGSSGEDSAAVLLSLLGVSLVLV